MDRLRDNVMAKASAFIVFIICMVIIVFSAVVVFFNAEYQWYSMSKNAVRSDINNEMLKYSNNLIVESCANMSDDTSLISYMPELIDGEKGASEFAYTITDKTVGDNGRIIRQVNPQLINKAGTTEYSMHHGDFLISVYLGNIDKGKTAVPVELYFQYSQYMTLYKYKTFAIVAGAFSAIVAIMMLVFLVNSAGRKKDNSAIIRNIPIELFGIVAILPLCILILFNFDLYGFGTDLFAVIIAADTVIMSILILGMLLITVSKLRQGNLWRSSITYHIFRGIRKIWGMFMYVLRSVPIVWKTVVLVAIALVFNFIVMVNWYYSGFAAIFWLLGALVISAASIIIARGLKKLKEGGEHLADGEFDYKVDKKGLYFDFAEHAENLNSIGRGMSKAVEAKTKSERFKAELITNVSHDIKTPLTSIINYVDFLKNEDVDNEKAREYIEVIDRQSQRLKKLTEDLVEVSKAATGNVKINMEPCKVGIMMTQVMGEYQEKANGEDLKLVLDAHLQDIEIIADGRSMWRIFDNLMNNICKYSQPGTRVYQTLEEQDGKAVITYKNTSKYELNVSADELMERFVRGDSSRHTEGSGLGLSIARNLVELQKGTFDIVIDGDLFKVIMTFDIV